MKCPHCLESFHAQWNSTQVHWPDQEWAEDLLLQAFLDVDLTCCASCHQFVIDLRWVVVRNVPEPQIQVIKQERVWPKGVARLPPPKEVPPEFGEDYLEACRVLDASPKASSAVSRRLLQHLLREKGRTTKKDLAEQIDEVIPSLPSDLGEAIDGVRVIGNFAAHPIKSKSTGEIVPVEPAEAEWLLDVLEALFDFYFVRPARLTEKRAAIDAKLKDAGKPPMK